MIFSSVFFIFAFLPTVLVCYYGQQVLFKNRLRNLTLLLASYFFYLFGAPDFILVLAGSTLFDYVMGRFMELNRGVSFSVRARKRTSWSPVHTPACRGLVVCIGQGHRHRHRAPGRQ